jgi:hypothetical protein
MKKKPPGQKSVVTGVSLPPDLDAWAKNYARRSTGDPTLKSSFSLVVQQALHEFRARVEGKATSTETGAEEAVDVGAGTINPSASSATLSSTVGTGRSRRVGSAR